MKIAVACTQYGPHGGTGRVTTELFERFARDGNEIHIFCGKHDEGIDYKVASVNDLGLKTKGIFLQLEMLAKATKAIDPSGYDLVYSTGDYYLHPDVVTVHSLMKRMRIARTAAERLGHTAKTGLVKRAARAIYMPLIYELGEKIVYRDRKPWYIGVSRGTVDEFVEDFHGGDSSRCVVIENGVDPDLFSYSAESRLRLRERFGFDAQDQVALFAGSDWGRKRLDLALAAVARIPGMKLVVVGHDDVRRYRDLVEASGCSDRVYFAGFSKEVQAFYSMADFFIFPTTYETFGLVALEAMSCGCIPLAHPVNGCKGFIRNGENGFLCDFGDVDAFVSNMERVIEDPSLRARLVAEGRKTAESMSWENVYQKYRTFFEQVLKEKRGDMQ